MDSKGKWRRVGERIRSSTKRAKSVINMKWFVIGLIVGTFTGGFIIGIMAGLALGILFSEALSRKKH